MPFEIRAIEADELDRMLLADQRGFGAPPPRPKASRSWAEAELDRTRVAFDGDEIAGVSRTYSFELTMPGGAMLPAAAVSWVSVLPTYRRRGVLRQLIAALHDDARAREEPIAMLTASESAIYGRFGYGVATYRLGLSAERTHVRFTNEEDDGRMRLVTRDEAEKVLPSLYDRVRALRAGMVSRPDFWWPQVFWEQFAGSKEDAFFVAVHTDASGIDDGFVGYEIKGEWHSGHADRTLVAEDMQAVDGRARAALWRYLFGVDLIKTVSTWSAPIDDPLRRIVADGRRVHVNYLIDGLWLAPLDPATVLGARTYAIDGRLVIDVRTPAGASQKVALEGGPAGAQCTTTDADPDLTCSTAALGACVLGGNRWSELADAGLVDVRDHDVLTRADAMFMTTPAPSMISAF
jgi:predicted acetyltransferase